ncbi:MAG: cytochrome ubiquinol oxidase subunit I [Pseudomonadota bacterium]
MDWITDHLIWSRLQFAMTTSFHIFWASLSVGLAVFLVIFEAAWLKTRNDVYYRQARFWSPFFLLIFAVGVVSGIPLEFQFGTNWDKFSIFTGGFFGHLLGFEAAMAFMLEAGFIGLMLLGWNRVPPKVHFFSTVMVALGSSLSVFWIMVANSWLQTPAGGQIVGGRFVLTDYTAAIFNPDWFLGFSHMWVACLETTAFVVGGISAWKILIKRDAAFFLKSFRVAFLVAVITAPLQFVLGDSSGRMIAEHQPAKLAATEAHWETNQPGQDAGWNALVWPNREEERNYFQIRIPYGLSLLITHSLHGRVTGLKDIPRDERPPVVIPFFAFRIMMGIGFGLIFLALWTAWVWYRGGLTPERIGEQKKPLFLWVCAVPMGYIAVVTGWMTREVGRQPWIVYGLLKTKNAASDLPATANGGFTLVLTAVYIFLFLIFLKFARKILAAGPDPMAQPPRPAGKD